MECKGIQERLSAYQDGAVSSEEKRLVEEHLTSCQECSTALQELKKTAELVRDLEEVEPPPWLTQKIMSRVREEKEAKRGIFQKLFYPLHVKVPIEALATVLIAVVAVYVFRAVEPQMKPAQLPAPPSPTITREEAPKPSREPAAPSPALRQEAAPPSPPGAAEEPRVAKQREAPAESYRQEMKAAGALEKKESPESRPTFRAAPEEREKTALSDSARDIRERKRVAAAPKLKVGEVAIKAPIDITVQVKDISGAGKEVENLLGQMGASKIKREPLEGKEVLTAEFKAQNLREFFEKLKAVGEIKEKKDVSFDIPEGNIAIRVEIMSPP